MPRTGGEATSVEQTKVPDLRPDCMINQNTGKCVRCPHASEEGKHFHAGTTTNDSLSTGWGCDEKNITRP